MQYSLAIPIFYIILVQWIHLKNVSDLIQDQMSRSRSIYIYIYNITEYIIESDFSHGDHHFAYFAVYKSWCHINYHCDIDKRGHCQGQGQSSMICANSLWRALVHNFLNYSQTWFVIHHVLRIWIKPCTSVLIEWFEFIIKVKRCRGHTAFGNHGHLQATMVTALFVASRNEWLKSESKPYTQVIIWFFLACRLILLSVSIDMVSQWPSRDSTRLG